MKSNHSSMLYLLSTYFLLLLLISCGVQVSQGKPRPVIIDPPTDPTHQAAEFLECVDGIRQYKLAWDATALAPEAKTYVAWDTLPDGSIANTGPGGNGNFGHSAQIGASMSRPPADPVIQAAIPDDSAHVLKILAIDSQVYFMSQTVEAIFDVPAGNCQRITQK
jgi:hypothetical protein